MNKPVGEKETVYVSVSLEDRRERGGREGETGTLTISQQGPFHSLRTEFSN